MRRRLPSLASLALLAVATCGAAPPKVVQAVAPIYPQFARVAHIQGVVVVAVEIGPDGKVSNAKTTSGPSLLREACLATARKWRFVPSSKRSRTVDLKFEFTVDDTLGIDSPPQISFPSPYSVAIRVAPAVLNASI